MSAQYPQSRKRSNAGGDRITPVKFESCQELDPLKRARHEKSPGTSASNKRRVSFPSVPCSMVSILPAIRQSKSCTALKEQTDLSPVQLLRSLRFDVVMKKLEQERFLAFVKPSQKALEDYEPTVVNAVRTGNLATLRSVEKDSLNACNQFGESLLHMACRRGHADVVRYMVEEAKVDVSVRDDFGRTVLHDAAWTTRPNKEVMEILLKAVNPLMLLAEDVRGHTPFDYARKEHWAEWVEFLSKHEGELSMRSDNQDGAVAYGGYHQAC